MTRYLIPLALFIVIALLLAGGLGRDTKLLPSPLIGKPMPALLAPELSDLSQQLDGKQWRGQYWLLNVWASWCAACRLEHPHLMALAQQQRIALIGLNYKDPTEEARQWLQKWGDPYSAIAVDRDGRIGIEWGVYGVPETFLIDPQGIILQRHVGPLDGDSIAALLRAANK